MGTKLKDMSWQTKYCERDAEAKHLRANFEEIGLAKLKAEEISRSLHKRLEKKRDFLGRLIAKLNIPVEVIQEIEEEQRLAYEKMKEEN